jgi:hypothetical protein
VLRHSRGRLRRLAYVASIAKVPPSLIGVWITASWQEGRMVQSQPRLRAGRLLDLRDLAFVARFDLVLRLAFVADFGWRRSGSSAPPAPRFHSSKVSAEILPSTNSSANFLRCALLLIGIGGSALTQGGPPAAVYGFYRRTCSSTIDHRVRVRSANSGKSFVAACP